MANTDEEEAREARRATRDSVLHILVNTAAPILGVVISNAGNPRTDQLVMVWLLLFVFVIAVNVSYSFVKSRRVQRYVTQTQHQEVLEAIKKLADSISELADTQSVTVEIDKASLRQQLATEHDNLVTKGDASDTQKRTWMLGYEQYLALCRKTHDSNGVIASYKQDILDLPPWDGVVRKNR
jgi:hypothetical protein